MCLYLDYYFIHNKTTCFFSHHFHIKIFLSFSVRLYLRRHTVSTGWTEWKVPWRPLKVLPNRQTNWRSSTDKWWGCIFGSEADYEVPPNLLASMWLRNWLELSLFLMLSSTDWSVTVSASPSIQTWSGTPRMNMRRRGRPTCLPWWLLWVSGRTLRW